MPSNKKGQAFRLDLKSGHPNCAIGPAQNEKFIRQHMVNKKILKMWPFTGCLDTHLAKSLPE